ncbi:hypothetical protein DFH06DRAFT_1408772 [Mycena polygramma]|nr:hypothetical protein DFH06DRAFT_1408772 [Mycena polygramma]
MRWWDTRFWLELLLQAVVKFTRRYTCGPLKLRKHSHRIDDHSVIDRRLPSSPMTNLEKGQRRKRDINHDEDAAAAKLWAVYVSEAEKYDRSLVETWKSDMEGLLIFAALFSAILTAFIVESYKSLNPDPSDLTVQLLEQISQQLAAAVNGTTFNIAPSPSFTPTVSSLVCNALWFISLGFSLACALIATLIQQWARDFLHKADMRSAPIIRARIFSYLYYGLKHFQMHTVVEVIPLLLHASLLLFFGGLVAFLIPVNIAMSAIAAAILAIVTAAYSTLTLLPLRYLDCPYQTPMSGTFWRILQSFKKIWRQRRNSTMVEAMSRAAMEYSDERDYNALVWTIKSLSDDVELEPFVEAIPDLLWGPTERRTSYDHHIQCLLRNPDVRLLDRIGDLLMSCDAGILAPDVTQRRQIACFKALWALASCAIQWSMPLDFSSLFASSALLNYANDFQNPGTKPYITSTRALMARSTFLAFKGRLSKLQHRLVACELDAAKSIDDSPELKEVAESFRHIRLRLESSGIPLSPSNCSPNLVDLRRRIKEYSNTTLGQISFNFFAQLSCLQSRPYRFDETRSILRKFRDLPASDHNLLGQAIYFVTLIWADTATQRIPDREEWIDKTLSELLSFWQPTDTDCIPRGIIVFLNGRQSKWDLKNVLLDSQTAETHLWNRFPKTLLEGAAPPPFVVRIPPSLPLEDMYTAFWWLAYSGAERSNSLHKPTSSQLQCLESGLSAVSNAEPRFTQISLSIVALLKFRITQEIHHSSAEVLHHIFGTFFAESRHKSEAEFGLVADYLEGCTSDVLPFNAFQTWNVIAPYLYLAEPIQATHQLPLANSIHTILSSAEKDAVFSRGIMNCGCWDLYARGHQTEGEVNVYRKRLDSDGTRLWPWLDDRVARQKIKETFTDYEGHLTASGDCSEIPGDIRFTASGNPRPNLLAHLHNILEGLDSWHHESDSSASADDNGPRAPSTRPT